MKKHASNKTKFLTKPSIVSLAVSCALLPSLSAKAQDVDEIIQVKGIKGSIERSLDTKRESAPIVDAISSEDLGKMPDQNIAESLQRVSGIQIDRSGGEGSVVRIRGMAQNLNTINGERLISGLGQTNQNSSFADLPAELFSQVVVYKSQTAKLIEGGIGGVIDLRTRKPFDFDEGDLQIVGSLKSIYGVESSDASPSASLLVSNNWGDFGALLSVSYTERDHLSDKAQFERGFRNNEVDTDGDNIADVS
ncbi:TonB-dependent receptor plug domain-containing protein [Catenovulum sediminis]|uniref:TonB-dependent receptor plug domain-containing protein n=1 Tax=Catenovulum sediminis TaxID=1740262 RepID=A0ABV1RCC5_9ALTE